MHCVHMLYCTMYVINHALCVYSLPLTLIKSLILSGTFAYLTILYILFYLLILFFCWHCVGGCTTFFELNSTVCHFRNPVKYKIKILHAYYKRVYFIFSQLFI